MGVAEEVFKSLDLRGGVGKLGSGLSSWDGISETSQGIEDSYPWDGNI